MELTLFNVWMDEHQGYDRKTIKMYERFTCQFFRWLQANRIATEDLNMISAGHIRDYRSYLAEVRELKPSTINKMLQAVRIFYRWAVEAGQASDSPAHRIGYIEEPILAPKSLDVNKEARIRAVIKNKSLRIQLLIELGLTAGLRISEAVALRTKDIILNDEICSISIRCGKGFKYRTVPISGFLLELITQYLAETKKHKSPYLFTDARTGKKISTRMVQKIIEEIREETGFYFTYHSLRHCFCFDLLNSGAKLADVAILAGHIKKNGMPNVSTTARYVLSRPEDLRNAIKEMEGWRRTDQLNNLG